MGDLLSSLSDQRSAALTKLQGVSEDGARQVVVASGWALRDMAYHLRVGEQFWVRAIAQGQAVDFDPDDPQGRYAWATPEQLTMADAVRLYREEGERTDRFLAALPSLDSPPARLPVWEFTHHWATSLRAIVIHLIEETARHAGHIDIVRELIDGYSGTLRQELRQRAAREPSEQQSSSRLGGP
jgi:uncharacterized damage-inducible protein DinB